ncbi:hypothetical protein J4221_05275 [Candidatus Pacearchaeota archaeon]|nr:hypothetical protein [Candidatus Pacearchaeota archaeon]
MDKPRSHVEQLAEYVKKNIKKGYTLDALKFSLINQGYTRFSVENAIALANKQLAEEIPPIKEKPQITYKIEDKEIELKQKKSFWNFLKKLFS